MNVNLELTVVTKMQHVSIWLDPTIVLVIWAFMEMELIVKVKQATQVILTSFDGGKILM